MICNFELKQSKHRTARMKFVITGIPLPEFYINPSVARTHKNCLWQKKKPYCTTVGKSTIFVVFDTCLFSVHNDRTNTNDWTEELNEIEKKKKGKIK